LIVSDLKLSTKISASIDSTARMSLPQVVVKSIRSVTEAKKTFCSCQVLKVFIIPCRLRYARSILCVTTPLTRPLAVNRISF
jgi:hypothetical protein